MAVAKRTLITPRGYFYPGSRLPDDHEDVQANPDLFDLDGDKSEGDPEGDDPIVSLGGGWYEVDGEKVKGRRAAEEAAGL